MQIKKSIVIIGLAVLLLAPLASAGFFDWITGRGTEGLTNMTATVTSNTAPRITSVNFTTSLNLNEGNAPSATTGTFTLVVYDLDGAIDVDKDKTWMNVSLAACNGENRNRNVYCTNTSLTTGGTGNYVNFTCPVVFNYYDCAGNWIVNASNKDLQGANATNDTTTLTVNTLNSMTVSPLAVNFGNLAVGDTDKASAVNNTANNTGNSLPVKIDLNSTNLKGETQTTYSFDASNFKSSNSNVSTSVNPCSSGIALTAGSYVIIGNASLGTRPLVNIDAGKPGQHTYVGYCIPAVPSLPRQNYTTAAEGKWTIRATF